jgi:hypothetical protein
VDGILCGVKTIGIVLRLINLDWGGRSLKAAYQQCLDDIEMEERVKQGKTIEIKI